MMDQRTKERMIAEETSRFMDGNFGQLDLSGSPDLNQHPAEEKFELQDRHGVNRVDESGLAGVNQLKELLANPPILRKRPKLTVVTSRMGIRASAKE